MNENEFTAKAIPKDPETGDLLPFTANGKKFYPLPDGAPIGPTRWSAYEKMSIVLGFGRTFKSLIDEIKAVKQLQYDDKPAGQIKLETSALIQSILDAAFSVKNDRFTMGFYVASIFIVREGEDPARWDASLAESMIADWAAENLSEQDLFFFALRKVNGYKAAWKKHASEQQKAAGELLARLGLKPDSTSHLQTSLSATFDEP